MKTWASILKGILRPKKEGKENSSCSSASEWICLLGTSFYTPMYQNQCWYFIKDIAAYTMLPRTTFKRIIIKLGKVLDEYCIMIYNMDVLNTGHMKFQWLHYLFLGNYNVPTGQISISRNICKGICWLCLPLVLRRFYLRASSPFSGTSLC